MRPPKQKQPQVKKELCRVLEHVDVHVDDSFRTASYRLHQFQPSMRFGLGSRIFFQAHVLGTENKSSRTSIQRLPIGS